MERTDAEALLRDAERLRRRARGDRHASSVPLLVFGALTVLSAPLTLPTLWPWGDVYWMLAGPAGLLVTGWWYRRQQARSGVGAGRGSYTVAGVSVLLACVVLPLVWIAPLPVVGAGLLVVAALQRNRYLAAWAVALGVLGGLERFFVLSNRLADLFEWFGWFQEPRDYGLLDDGSTIVFAALGGLLLAAGLVALRRERAGLVALRRERAGR
jgi:hypothetical protein